MADVVGQVVDVGAEPDHRRLMADGLDAGERRGDGRRVADIAVDELSVWVDDRLLAVGGRQHAVEHPDEVAVSEQPIDDRGTDEAGAAGDENHDSNGRQSLAARGGSGGHCSQTRKG